MNQLTPAGQQVVSDLAQRHGFSVDAVTHMLFAVVSGRGSMAQFNHYEFGGSGQWMRGGMIMLGDMFNNSLKGRVDALCSELSDMLANQPAWLAPTGSFQSQSQTSDQYSNHGSNFIGKHAWIAPDPDAQFWPSDLGSPNAVGSQNQVRYAYFQDRHRLAVKTGDQVWVYDTLDHQIGGFSQQQGSNPGILFTSQYGAVNLSSLPVVSRNGQPVAAPPAPPPPPAPTQSFTSVPSAPPSPVGESMPNGANGDTTALLSTLERLGDLKAKGLLTEEEFASKKAEILKRL